MENTEINNQPCPEKCCQKESDHQQNNHQQSKKSLRNTFLAVFLMLVAISGIWFYKQVNSASIDDIDYTESFDLAALKSSGLPFILVFGGDNCPICEEVGPRVVKLQEKYEGQVIIQYVNVWKNKDAGEGFYIPMLPTIYFLSSEGEIIDYNIGNIDMNGLIEKTKGILE